MITKVKMWVNLEKAYLIFFDSLWNYESDNFLAYKVAPLADLL